MTPDQYTNQELFLDAGDGHQIYVHDWGDKDAKTPILFMHGGPGNGCADKDKSSFDPQTQRVIFHDQRGSGKSTPTGHLDNNTSADLTGDFKKILDKLDIDKAVLYGGSWGSTLALLCAIAHPDRVSGLVIHGVFTASLDEINWVEQGGFADFFPEVWQEYQETVPAEYQDNPSKYHFPRALGDNPEEAKESVYAYQKMELAILKLDDKYEPGPYANFDPTSGKIEVHYLANGCFVEEGYIFKNASKLTMPVYLIQGRYDMVCPPIAAYKLHQLLPNSQLIWTINGHLRQHEARNIASLALKQLGGN